MTRIVISTLALSLVIVNVVASANELTKQQTDLLALYIKAVDHDPQLQTALADRLAGEEALPQARSGLLPSIVLSAEKGRIKRRSQEINRIAPAREHHFSRRVLQINVVQPIVDLQEWYRYRAGEYLYRQAEAEYLDAVQELGERLTTAYFRVLRAESNLATRQAEQDALKRQQNQVQKELEAGIASRIDVLDVAAEVRRVAVERVRAKSEFDQSLRALETIAGERLSTVRPLQRTPIRVELDSIDVLKAKAEANNPRLLLAQYRTQTSQQNAKAARAAHLPTLSLELSAQRDISGAEVALPGASELTTDTASVALRLEMLVFSGGRTSSQRREAAFLLERSRQSYRLIREEVLSEVESLSEVVHTEYQAIEAAQQALSAQRAAFEAVQRGHEAGVRDLVDILRARREQFAAVDVLNEAKYGYVTTLARLYRLTGTLNQQKIEQLNNWLGAQ